MAEPLPAVPSSPSSQGTATPKFVVCPSALEAAYASFVAAFPGANVHYAMKANATPGILQVLDAAGAGFEVASVGEHQALMHACPDLKADRIIFGTAVKSASAIRTLAGAGVDRMAADSSTELKRIAQEAPGSRVMLRAVVGHGDSVFTMSDKFGAPIDALVDLGVEAQSLGLVPWAVCFNVGSQAGQAAAWGDAVAALAPAAEGLLQRGVQLPALNLGGGYPYAYPGRARIPLEDIAELVDVALGTWPYRPRLLLEPGRALVAGAADLYTTVVSRVRRGSRDWLYLDAGVYNALFEALSCQGTTRYTTELWSRASSQALHHFVLAGPTGDGLDVISESTLLPRDVGEGDVLKVGGTGAYSSSLASDFNGFAPATTTLHHPTVSCAVCGDQGEGVLPAQREAVS